mmetsp:Transcript_13359/g.17303  ORF Transcript_13359/g.17303 Transcript_13359/m.17303 type:complete len:395 (+) Transcript_13359:91-1275(+)
MFSNVGAVHGVKLKSRCLAAQEADEDRHRFFIGSSCLREENELILVEFNEELVDSVCCVQTYSHPKEVSCLAPSPINPSLLFTCAGDGECTLWKAPDADQSMDLDNKNDPNHDKTSLSPLEKLASLPEDKTSTTSKVVWQPRTFGSEKVASFRSSKVEVWDVRGEAIDEMVSFENSGNEVLSCAWDPHNTNLMTSTQGSDALGWDIRAQKKTFSLNAHKYHARDVDYNPNKPYHIVTCGDDRLIKIWDLRNPDKPIRMLAGHTHWCSSVKYNRFHDQLLLSGGTDSLVNLWRCSSVSSAPLLELDDHLNSSGHGTSNDGIDSDDDHNYMSSNQNSQQEPSDAIDCIVKTYDEHEESVYSITWSSCDAWVFASLDFSGRLAINHVPSTEKYKILL